MSLFEPLAQGNDADANPLLFDPGKSWDEHWQDMPEFTRESREPYRSIRIHFETEEDAQEFAGTIGQVVTSQTNFLWYPKMENELVLGRGMRYVEDAR